MKKPLIERAADLITLLDEHEGAEGWSQGMREAIDEWFKEFKATRRKS